MNELNYFKYMGFLKMLSGNQYELPSTPSGETLNPPGGPLLLHQLPQHQRFQPRKRPGMLTPHPR